MDNGYRIIGVLEVAELLEVEVRTPHTWRYRKLMPEYDYESINGEGAWDRETIVRWAALTGRLPSYLAAEGVKVTGDEFLPTRRGGRRAKARVEREMGNAS